MEIVFDYPIHIDIAKVTSVSIGNLVELVKFLKIVWMDNNHSYSTCLPFHRLKYQSCQISARGLGMRLGGLHL